LPNWLCRWRRCSWPARHWKQRTALKVRRYELLLAFPCYDPAGLLYRIEAQPHGDGNSEHPNTFPVWGMQIRRSPEGPRPVISQRRFDNPIDPGDCAEVGSLKPDRPPGWQARVYSTCRIVYPVRARTWCLSVRWQWNREPARCPN